MLEAHDRGLGGSARERRSAERMWPAVVATEQLAYRTLAACWAMERGGSGVSAIVSAVDRGYVDVAVVWGPIAGYFARRSQAPLELTPVAPERDSPSLPFVFDISMAVRRGDAVRLAELDDFLVRRRTDVDAILDRYRVPLVEAH